MELNQIKQFRVIAQTGSISKAAKKLFIAQPSLSQTLKRLEDELGYRLFDRCGKKVVLNGAGKIFLKYCDEIVMLLENASLELAEYNGDAKKEMNIVVESASLMSLEIVDKMRSQFPRSRLHFSLSTAGDWDIKICAAMGPDCGCPSEVIIEEPIGVIFPKSHSLAAKKTLLKKDIEGCEFISLSPDTNFTHITSSYCAMANFKPNITMYVDFPSVIQDLIKQGFGIAFAPEYTRYKVYNGELEFRIISDMPMKQFIHIILNEKKYITNDTRTCYNDVAGFFREYIRKFT